MKKIVGYLRNYISSLNGWVFLFSTILTALAVYINYHFHLNRAIAQLSGIWPFLAWYALFLLLFGAGYVLQKIFLNTDIFYHRQFLLLLSIAPAVFAWKMEAAFHFKFSTDIFENEYWNAIVYWPIKVVVITTILFAIHYFFDRQKPFYGLTTKNFTSKPYIFMLLIMVSLIAIAATQKDFQHMYPRMQNIEYLFLPGKALHKVLYELSYGSDFFSIEIFFRGFLVFAFTKWAGKNAILPMAMFYCAIHFGKPLGECISSFFGGIILGVVSYNTGTILGGFMVHVGIAWLMELGGYLHPLSP